MLIIILTRTNRKRIGNLIKKPPLASLGRGGKISCNIQHWICNLLRNHFTDILVPSDKKTKNSTYIINEITLWKYQLQLFLQFNSFFLFKLEFNFLPTNNEIFVDKFEIVC